MRRLSWLQLTDFHCGITEQRRLWPNVNEVFFKDLERMHTKTGPWSVVFFTGDLVQYGLAEEFKRLDDILGTIWEKFNKLGSDPLLVPVPGNHDLQRPQSSAAFKLLTNDYPKIQEDFWCDSSNEYRAVVNAAFNNYSEWLKKCPFVAKDKTKFMDGDLPGEFSLSWEIDKIKVGVVGLNTAFLQLAAGDFKGRLAWDQRQLHAACGGNAPQWIDGHDIRFLITHHGPDWLNARSATEELAEISPAGRFFAHLFGHNHLPCNLNQKLNNGPAQNLWQGRALFGLEQFGDDDKKDDRQHGYTIYTINFDDEGNGSLRTWPRVAIRYPNGWKVIPDYLFPIEDDQGTTAEELKNLVSPVRPSKQITLKRVPISFGTSDAGMNFERCLEGLRREFSEGGIFWAFTQADTKSEVEGDVLVQIALDRLLYVATRLREERISANIWVCHQLYGDGRPRFLRSLMREGYFEIRQLVDRPANDILYRSNEIFYSDTSLDLMSVAARTVVQKKPIFRATADSQYDSRKELDRGITHILGVPSRDYNQSPAVVKGEPLSITVDFKFAYVDVPRETEDAIVTAGDEVRRVFQQVLDLWYEVKNKAALSRARERSPVA